MITKEDITNVAKSVNVELTDSEIKWVLNSYTEAQEQDPTGTWNLVIENLIHQVKEMRNDETRYDLEIYGEDASTDDCWFDYDDDIDIGTQIV